MKRVATLSLIALCTSGAYATNNDLSFAERLIQATNYINHHQRATWPGFHLDRTPMIITFSDDHRFRMYAFNFKPVDPEWKSITVAGQTIYTMDKDKYDLKYIAWGFEKIDGQRTFVRGADENLAPIDNVRETTYFRFYNYQHFTHESHFVDTGFDMPFYAGMRDMEQIKLAYLEMQALEAYLKAQDEDARYIAMRDAISINQYRMSTLDPDSSLYDPFAARYWGLSNYVSWKSVELKDRTQYMQAITSDCDVNQQPKLDYQTAENCMMYQRYNVMTLVYGLMLDDRMQGKWKSEREHDSADKIVRDLFGMKLEWAKENVDEIVQTKRYGYDKISRLVEDNIAPYLHKIDEAELAYKNLPGVEMEIRTWSDMIDASKKYMPKKLRMDENQFRIDNRTVLLKDASRQYSEGKNGSTAARILEFSHIPYLYDSTWITPVDGWVKFKIAPQTVVMIDGVKTTVADLVANKRYVAFTNLEMTTMDVTLQYRNMHGFLDARSGMLKLKSSY